MPPDEDPDVPRCDEKYSRLPAFAQALRRIRRRTAADVRKTGLPRAKVLAAERHDATAKTGCRMR